MTHVCGSRCARFFLKVPAGTGQSEVTRSLHFSPRGLGTGQDMERGPVGEFGRLLRMVSRHPSVADKMVQSHGGGPGPCFLAARSCVRSLTEAGFDVSSRTSLAESQEVLFAQEPNPTNQRQSGNTKPPRDCTRSSRSDLLAKTYGR